jgi:hypothetical protein
MMLFIVNISYLVWIDFVVAIMPNEVDVISSNLPPPLMRTCKKKKRFCGCDIKLYARSIQNHSLFHINSIIN